MLARVAEGVMIMTEHHQLDLAGAALKVGVLGLALVAMMVHR